jgi:GT2 family glycosyltransferase
MFQVAAQEHPDVNIFVPNIFSGKLLISPTKTNILKSLKQSVTGLLFLSEYNAINSGMLVNTDALLSVGGYNEDVWLDYSDYEFLSRMRKGGFRHLFVIDGVCYQSFSDHIQTSQQKLDRYVVFCRCLQKCEKDTLMTNLFFFYQALKRMVSLLFKTRSFKPIVIFTKNYLSK